MLSPTQVLINVDSKKLVKLLFHGPHVKQIYIPSQHANAGLTILNVLPPKQLLLGMHSIKVWSLAPYWMHSRWYWGDRCQASVFEHTNLSCF